MKPNPDKPAKGRRASQKFQITNIKFPKNHNDRNSKFQTCSRYRKKEPIKTVLVIEYCNLFVICLPAVFLVGCLVFEILAVGACALFYALNAQK
jgi:hypothetical protein